MVIYLFTSCRRVDRPTSIPLLRRLSSGNSLTDDDVHSLWASSPSVIAYETGKLSAQAFAEDVESDLGLAVSPEDFITNFSGWANSLYPGTMELFEALPNSLLVAALSNTNEIHWTDIAVLGLADMSEHV